MAATLISNKKALRKALATTLRALSQEDVRAQSSAIVHRILNEPFFGAASTVSCYLSMPSGEANTSAVVEAILASGKTLFVPKVDPVVPGVMDLLKIHDKADLQSLPSGVWGIREPTYQYGDAPRTKATDSDADPLDIVLIPGVAFDRSLARLGHGKGYYDRFLSSYSALAKSRGYPRPILVGIALREQILPAGEVPVGESDVELDVIVTPDETILRPPRHSPPHSLERVHGIDSS
ncbi:nagb/rpia/CoA transferase-like protein [Gloeopeniophorella convolvens]|nr:nagb/rpia/CoA transferase-like protein [Gloeopeniophorella convolvens]